MFEHIEEIYADMRPMMKRLRKKNYEEQMKQFRQTHGHYFDEMLAVMASAEDSETAAGKVSEALIARVKETYSNKKGKIPGHTHGDLDLFMIYFVYPAILLTHDVHARTLCDVLCAKWNEAMGSNMQYADYKVIYNGFREKIFNIFR